jgi:hypothetical protein
VATALTTCCCCCVTRHSRARSLLLLLLLLLQLLLLSPSEVLKEGICWCGLLPLLLPLPRLLEHCGLLGTLLLLLLLQVPQQLLCRWCNHNRCTSCLLLAITCAYAVDVVRPNPVL